jgi:hypothetical protein
MNEKASVFNTLYNELVSLGQRSELNKNNELTVRIMKSGKYGFFFKELPNTTILEQDVDSYISYMCDDIEKYQKTLDRHKKASEIVSRILTVISDEELQYVFNHYNGDSNEEM